jgi:oligopeptide/dipeptide ABC transporter ATP-binding protein
MSDKIMVMYLGTPMEIAHTSDLFNSPKHPYTKALLRAIPIPDPSKKESPIKLKGEMPSPVKLPSGCVFHTRCPNFSKECSKKKPKLIEVGEEHFVACHQI